MDLVSVIVAVYNVESYLERCMDSVLNQKYSNLDIILVDDGSTDKSGDICDSYSFEPRVRIIHKKNAGLGRARNSGLEIATGKYVVFLDSDDYIGKYHIYNMVEMIRKTHADTCMAGFTKVYSKSNVSHPHIYSTKVFENDEINQMILPKMCGADSSGKDYIEMSVCMVMMSNDIIQSNKLRFVSERELISEDLVFDFEYYPLTKRVCILDGTDYYYCDNEGSLTTKYRPNRFAMQIKLYEEIMRRAIELNLEKECRARLDSTLIAIARYSIKLEEKFSKQQGRRCVRNSIKEICDNQLLLAILKNTDTSGLKKTSKVVNFLIKKKMILLLRFAMKVKNIFNM